MLKLEMMAEADSYRGDRAEVKVECSAPGVRLSVQAQGEAVVIYLSPARAKTLAQALLSAVELQGK